MAGPQIKDSDFDVSPISLTQQTKSDTTTLNIGMINGVEAPYCFFSFNTLCTREEVQYYLSIYTQRTTTITMENALDFMTLSRQINELYSKTQSTGVVSISDFSLYRDCVLRMMLFYDLFMKKRIIPALLMTDSPDSEIGKKFVSYLSENQKHWIPKKKPLVYASLLQMFNWAMKSSPTDVRILAPNGSLSVFEFSRKIKRGNGKIENTTITRKSIPHTLKSIGHFFETILCTVKKSSPKSIAN